MNKLLILIAILTLTSCISKKKVLEKEKEKTELTVDTETKKEETQVTKEEKSQVKTTDSIAEKNEVTVIDAKEKIVDIIADDGNEVTVTQEKTATGTKTTYTGVSKVNVRDKSTNETKTLNERIRLLRNDSINWVKQDSIKTIEWEKEVLSLQQEIKRIKSEKEKTGSCSFFIWGFFILLILVIGYIVYRIKRKSPI